ncbi:hypothetical protein VOLCADRAFT_99822 [Volvox carteri f. nagariensis]|uniref:Uncharacterized protein n=1 Tax=Volvox carteri f. nagariensis TaxID=3068 RepID=D8UIR2_VOLCA|nr:uncharacterized protein VOLCADRAFT_99822 [Volvox carteri f. nagariensis]EFJ40402.1 hypothetical protein VOLCADRAFT_99822 [Volvox carteri f. nagariensis]|eukprot:XP_002958553.1 hypothetical protein VOLCADRAFT_99822 [Volvox carteri f. nagariensis]
MRRARPPATRETFSASWATEGFTLGPCYPSCWIRTYKGVTKGLPGVEGAAGGTDVTATIRARACYSSKYAAHLVVEPPNYPPYKEAATVVGPHHVAMFAHGRHGKWTLGQQMQIAVHCPDTDRRVLVDSTVVRINPIQDVAILELRLRLALALLLHCLRHKSHTDHLNWGFSSPLTSLHQ